MQLEHCELLSAAPVYELAFDQQEMTQRGHPRLEPEIWS